MESPKPVPSKTRHDDGHLVKLQRGRMTKLRPLGPCELFILPEFKDGRMQIRVWGMDGVEIEHFRLEDNDQKEANQTVGENVN